MKTKYFSLIVAHKDDGVWSVQFGDYDREVVKDELEDEWKGVPGVRTRIITTNGTQAAIDAAVLELNTTGVLS